jgi:uncharacterized metal-binding protein
MTKPGDTETSDAGFACAECGRLACNAGDGRAFPEGCPAPDGADDELVGRYLEGEDASLARVAALVEAHGYGRLTRLEEIMDFARRSGYSKLGLAFCVGLRREAAVVSRVFRANGLSVESVVCKNAGIGKDEIGITGEDQVRPGEFEAACNPIGQARALAIAGTELNVVLGLCVGHDSLFFRHSEAPVTVLAVKDRVLGHNPLAAVYQANSYYRARLFPEGDGDTSG